MQYKNHLKIEQNGNVVDIEFITVFPFSSHIEHFTANNPNMSLELTTKYDGYLEDTLFATLKVKEGLVINPDECSYRESLMLQNLSWHSRLPESIRNNKQFYLQRAKLIQHADFKVHSDLDSASDQLKDDAEFVLELMKYNIKAYSCASSRVKAMPSVLKEYLKYASKKEISHLQKDNRITIAYELCKINPNYSECFGEPLKKRLNGMTITDYVDIQNLHKSLKNNLVKKQAVARIKI